MSNTETYPNRFPKSTLMKNCNGAHVSVLMVDHEQEDVTALREAIKECIPEITFRSIDNGFSLMNHIVPGDNPLPDIIFLDINLPSKPGMQCLKEIRSNKKFDATLIFMFSELNDSNLVLKAFNNGANFYIHKPTFSSDLQLIINKLFGNGLPSPMEKNNKEEFFLMADAKGVYWKKLW